MPEVVEICRQVWRRERVHYAGKHYQIPLPADRGTGLGKPLQLINHPVRERIPISIAAISITPAPWISPSPGCSVTSRRAACWTRRLLPG